VVLGLEPRERVREGGREGGLEEESISSMRKGAESIFVWSSGRQGLLWYSGWNLREGGREGGRAGVYELVTMVSP